MNKTKITTMKLKNVKDKVYYLMVIALIILLIIFLFQGCLPAKTVAKIEHSNTMLWYHYGAVLIDSTKQVNKYQTKYYCSHPHPANNEHYSFRYYDEDSVFVNDTLILNDEIRALMKY